jgi:hypothetical protein
MTQLADFYDAFLDAVIAGRPKALGALLEPRHTAENAIVYRNTVFRGAADALATAFPAVGRLAGASYFEAIAIAYVEAHPPRSRTLVGYGTQFPEFLETAPGIDAAPYLSDIARLDRAWLAAHLAADQLPLTGDALAASPPEQLAQRCLPLHPSVQLITLSWDAHAAWSANRAESDASCDVREVRPARQNVVFWRPYHQVQSQILTQAEAEFLATMLAGRSLNESALAALTLDPEFDVGQFFAGAIAAGLFADLPHTADAGQEH